MLRYVSSPAYEVDLGAHVFPTSKYRRVCEALRDEHGASSDAFVEPPPAGAQAILRVHERGYFQRCHDGTLGVDEQLRMELPWSPALFEAAARAVSGSILAAEMALEHRVGLHVGGGFHHAFPAHGEGFCVFNDIACAIEALRADGRVNRALVADCDLHQGNGTAAIFADDPTVATYSIHQQDIYPFHKPPSTVDVGLPAGTTDERYLGALSETLPPLLARHEPELLVYVAGGDPFRDDQLGSLALSIDGLRRRDRLVVELAREREVPTLLVLAGGYAARIEDTVTIHLQSVVEAARLWR